MSNVFLVRHPAPFPTESLIGYVLRLSEANGYPTPWGLYQLAGMDQFETRGTGMNTVKLMQIAQRSVSELDAITFAARDGNARACQLLGHTLIPTDLSLTRAAICTLCVEEKGFIEAHWHLSLMVGCPLHNFGLTSVCSACGDPIGWFRPGLLQCRCEAHFINAPTGPLGEATRSLLRILRSRALGMPISPDESPLMPTDDLAAMELRALLALIQTLGRYRLRASCVSEASNHSAIVQAAAEVLSQWPLNFFRLLADTTLRRSTAERLSLCAASGTLYTSLFKGYRGRERKQTRFIRRAFLEFAAQHWHGYVDPKLFKEDVSESLPKRFATVTQFACRAGIQTRAVKRYLRDNPEQVVSVNQHSSSRTLIDTVQASVPARLSARVLRARDAAKRLDIPVSLLKAVRESGLAKFRDTFTGRPGYDEGEVESFRSHLLGLLDIVAKTSKEEPLMPLAQVLRNPHDATVVKLKLMEAILSGAIPVARGEKEASERLHIGRTAYVDFIDRVRLQRRGSAEPARRVAKELRCDPACLPSLIKLGLLHGCYASGGLQIGSNSIEVFCREWISLARIARDHKTSSRALMKHCHLAEIPVMFVKGRLGAGPQPFIRISDELRLRPTIPSS